MYAVVYEPRGRGKISGTSVRVYGRGCPADQPPCACGERRRSERRERAAGSLQVNTSGKKSIQWVEPSDKSEKKEKNSRSRDKMSREKEKDRDRKERRVGRKRDRMTEDISTDGRKLRKDEEKSKGSDKLSGGHQNGGSDRVSYDSLEYYGKESSPPYNPYGPTYQTNLSPERDRETRDNQYPFIYT
ncbi:hypothetical protein RUM43_006610 [Polyplax serrata]|uniref:Uncharacterized protein n=1 Tax=Polyplax serrata TaxID=468196 RepID=A0AAN8NYG4_POLSC